MADPKRVSIEALSVAYLAAGGKTQIEIARILGLSQTAVSRMYSEVRTTYVKTTFCEDKVDREVLEKIRRRTSRHHLEDRLKALAEKNGHQGPMVHSIFLPDVSDDAPQVHRFAVEAAPGVYNLLKQVRKTVGVAWGNTLWQTTQHLRTFLEGPWRQDFPIEFIPLCGDPLVDSVKAQRYADRTSSHIASELSKIVNGDGPRPLWLGLVPAFIPRTFNGSERRAIDRFIDLGPHYGRIFGPRNRSQGTERPLAEDLDMILTAAGSSKYPVRFGQGPLLQLEDGAAKMLEDCIHGDIGGALVPKFDQSDKKKAPGQNLVAELNGLWTGLKMEHLKVCAQSAFAEDSGRGKRPGVTLLAYRKELGDVVCQAVRWGLVNHLIIGSPLEAAIENALAA